MSAHISIVSCSTIDSGGFFYHLWDFRIIVTTTGYNMCIEPQDYYKSKRTALVAAKRWCHRINAKIKEIEIIE